MPSPKVTINEALQYEEEGLLVGIDKCKKNISLFEEAIANERETIDRYNQMITIIQIHKQK